MSWHNIENTFLNQHRLGLFYNLAYIHFGAKKYEAALDWINELLNDPDLKTREDIHSFGQILNLFIHYELGNDKLLEYIVKSTYRFLLKRKRLFKVESSNSSLFEKISKLDHQPGDFKRLQRIERRIAAAR